MLFRSVAQKWAVYALALVTLSGCALDPVNMVLRARAAGSMSQESLVAESAEIYRMMDCDSLKHYLEHSSNTAGMTQRHIEGAAINAIAARQVMAEKNCTAAIASSPGQPTSAASVAATSQSGAATPGRPAQPEAPKGAMGVVVAPVTSEVAQAAGLAQPKGVLVTQLVEGRGAAASGIRVGDIILEVRGIPVADGFQVQAALGPIPDGQSAKVRLWRAKEERDLIVGPISSTTPALPPGATYADAPMLTAQPVGDRYCVIQLTGSGMSAAGLRSPLLTLRHDGSEKASAKVADAFMRSVQQAQPGKWQPQSALRCDKDSKVCTSTSSKPEVFMMLCETDQSKGAAIYDSLQRHKPLTDFPWTPPPM